MRVVVLSYLLVAALGCGGNAVRVNGQLTKDGQPYTVKATGAMPDTVSVDLIGPGSLFSAEVADDGTFKVPGVSGGGVPPGTYKVAVLHSGYMGEGGDRFGAKFTPDKTPLTVDLTNARSARLAIDVGRGTVAVE